MEEPEDAPPLPPSGVDDDVLAVQRSGLHNVSNTCYLNATVQVQHFSRRSLKMMCVEPLFVVACVRTVLTTPKRVLMRAFGGER